MTSSGSRKEERVEERVDIRNFNVDALTAWFYLFDFNREFVETSKSKSI